MELKCGRVVGFQDITNHPNQQSGFGTYSEHKMNHVIILILILLTSANVGDTQFDEALGQIGDFLREMRLSVRGPNVKSASLDRDVEEYDFIVIGAGSAGAVVASRLSENPNWKVLLLEAGPSEFILGQIPFIGHALIGSQYYWNYKTTPQNTSCLGSLNNQCHLRTGRGLGGGSAINGVVYARGNKADFDDWEAQGNPGWSYQDVLPYFKKSEDVHLPCYDSSYHGRGGPLEVEENDNTSEEITAFINAGEELGYKYIDYNGADSIGISRYQVIGRKGRRLSTSIAYLESITNRKNLIIKTYSRAMKIIFNENKRATGVSYRREGRSLLAKASKEIIVSCGALNTPQLLMVSGIGPKENLEEFAVPVIQDLKVGDNLLDQVAFLGLSFYYNAKESQNHLSNLLDWVFAGSGLYRTDGVDVMAYVRTSPTLTYPDIELSLQSQTLSQGYELAKATLGMKEEVYDSLWKSYEGRKGFNILVRLLSPKSAGRVKIQANTTVTPPLIDTNYLSADEDINTLVKGIRKALRFTQTISFKKLGAKINKSKVAGCEIHTFDTDEYWACAIRFLHITSFLYQGTCKMGPERDPDAVVDEELKVHGVEGLRVVDTSVIPTRMTGHLEAVAVMIAEKGSELIKERWV